LKASGATVPPDAGLARTVTVQVSEGELRSAQPKARRVRARARQDARVANKIFLLVFINKWFLDLVMFCYFFKYKKSNSSSFKSFGDWGGASNAPIP
jgi:hypothetical protein